MARTERLLEVMLRLQTLHRFTVQEIAQEFHVSRRTMLRDLQALSEMGVPLAATPGPHGGYVLLQKQRLLPLSLTEDEAIGIVLSYESLLEYADTPFSQQSLSAITKLRNALPPDVVQRLDRTREHIVITGMQRVYTAPLLADILHAAMEKTHLRIVYDSRTKTAERLIYPYGLYASNGFWYCACFDHKRQQHISLRADRFLSLERVEGVKPTTTLSIREWLQAIDDDEGPLLLLHVTISRRGMKDVDWAAFHHQIVIDEQGCGSITKEIPQSELDFYARLFLPLGKEAVIASPPELIQAIQKRAREVLEQYP